MYITPIVKGHPLLIGAELVGQLIKSAQIATAPVLIELWYMYIQVRQLLQ